MTDTSPATGLIAVYSGSFDPVTRGHIDIVERTSRLFDEVIVAVGRHPTKQGFFPVEERCELIEASIKHLPNARAAHFSGLAVEFCRQVGAKIIIRGLRAVGDFEPELKMGMANRNLNAEVETLFMLPSPEMTYVSSSLVRELAEFGGAYARYVTPPVLEAMKKRFDDGASPSSSS